MLVALALLALTGPAWADPAPSQTAGRTTLKWRPKNAPVVQASAEEPVSQPARLAAEPAAQRLQPIEASEEAESAGKPVVVPPRRESRVRRASGQEKVTELSTRQSRAKLRNAILQVSNERSLGFEEPVAEEPSLDPPTKAAQEPSLEPSANEPSLDEPRLDSTLEPPPSAEPERPGPSMKDNDLEPGEPIPLRRDTDLLPPDQTPLPPGRDELPFGSPSVEGCEVERGDCEKALRGLQQRDIRNVLVALSISGVEGNDYPCECGLGNEVYKGRSFAPTTFTWKATGVCHHPLYFEDAQLERYGHSWNPVVQPFMSAAHFFVSIPLLPYQMGLNPPNECIYTLGYYRPGSCAPYVIEPIPWSLRGALYEAGAAVGFAYWFFPPLPAK